MDFRKVSKYIIFAGGKYFNVMKQARLITLLFTLTVPMSVSAQNFQSKRPAEGERLFTSEKIESVIDNVTAQLTNPKLAWMFRNCFPNTLDTTVHFREDSDEIGRAHV